jgi:hypothetical protein
LGAVVVGCCWAGSVIAGAPQQIVDPDFRAVVEHPAYSGNGPTVAIDEAHSRFHTAGGQYAPFAALLKNDGYRVTESTRPFAADALTGIAVLVVANARNLKAIMAGDISKPAFTEQECEEVRDWVRSGGSLLLIADHAPYGNAAQNLAERFGVGMGTGWAFERAPGGGITTQLVFSRENGLLGTHPILKGRNESEAIKSVKSFTGQSLSPPPDATVILKLSANAREAAMPDDLNAEDEAARSGAATYGSRSASVAGRAQGLALTFGQGRVVVLGEAALLSAQILRVTENGQQRETRFGMNVPGYGDRQFALNVMHRLSRVLN